MPNKQMLLALSVAVGGTAGALIGRAIGRRHATVASGLLIEEYIAATQLGKSGQGSARTVPTRNDFSPAGIASMLANMNVAGCAGWNALSLYEKASRVKTLVYGKNSTSDETAIRAWIQRIDSACVASPSVPLRAPSMPWTMVHNDALATQLLIDLAKVGGVASEGEHLGGSGCSAWKRASETARNLAVAGLYRYYADASDYSGDLQNLANEKLNAVNRIMSLAKGSWTKAQLVTLSWYPAQVLALFPPVAETRTFLDAYCATRVG